MRSAFRPILFACLGFVFASARGESTTTSDIFLNAYLECGKAEKLEATGDSAGAIESYKRAITLLDQVTRYDAAWKPEMVKRRRERTAEAIARLESGGENSEGAPPKMIDQNKLIGDLPSKSGAIIPGTEEFVPKKGGGKKTPPMAAAQPSGDRALESAGAYMKKIEADLATTKDTLGQTIREKDELAKKYDKALKDSAEAAERQMKLEKRAKLALKLSSRKHMPPKKK